jgi:hypothetical protein
MVVKIDLLCNDNERYTVIPTVNKKQPPVDATGDSHDNRPKQIAYFDCLRNYGAAEFFSHGKVKLVRGPAGRYREAEGRPLSRFGYRFAVTKIGRPHLLVIRYPDDKRRFMIVNDGTTFDLSAGLTTGHAFPLSGRMQEMRQVFWPRWTDCSVCFMTWGHGEPAAVASVEIYELDDLPELDIPQQKHRRELGIQYEDPICPTANSEGAMTFPDWLDRVVSYAKFTGQSLLSYPICWYHGPFFPSKREPSSAFVWLTARDRKQYMAWTTQPPDWPAAVLERFGKEGMDFQGVVTLLRLGSLMKQMNVDLPAIQKGAPTINNMLWCDQVQAGTMDWTTVYNPANFKELAKRPHPLSASQEFPWAYGEKSGQPYHPGPIFNPLHPIVQKAIIGFIREIGQRYGAYPAFKGIALTMWAPTIIWFGSIHSGYDDYTVGCFQRETGINVPVDKASPSRFSERYEFLAYRCRKAWVAWRCSKVHELVCRLRDALVAARPDLRLTLNLWSEPYVPAILGAPGGPEHQIYSRQAAVDLYREAGLDPELFLNEHNIEFDLQTDGGGRDRTPSLSEDAPLESFFMHRDHDFLDRKTLAAIHAQRNPGVFIFNNWHEAWGEHTWSACESNDPNLPEAAKVYGKKAEGVLRLNSAYPPDRFWWDSQLRIASAFPPAPHYMEQYAHAVAEMDAVRITRGGIYLDKAHGEGLREFARAFRALPREKFETVGDSTDPVAVRTLSRAGRRYLYLVNREYYPVEVDVRFDRAPKRLVDLSTGLEQSAAASCTIRLQPYQLRSFATDVSAEVSGFSVAVPPAIKKSILSRARRLLKLLQQQHRAGQFFAGAEEMRTVIESALAEKRYACLRRALSSYIAQRCESAPSGRRHRSGSAKRKTNL